MIKVIKDDYQTFVRNSNKQKTQEAELQRYKEDAIKHQRTIDDLKKEIDQKQEDYNEKEEERKKLEKYKEFLITVTKNKEHASEDATSIENEIENLRRRFLNLKKEAKNLKERKFKINKETENVREQERIRLGGLT